MSAKIHTDRSWYIKVALIVFFMMGLAHITRPLDISSSIDSQKNVFSKIAKLVSPGILFLTFEIRLNFMITSF